MKKILALAIGLGIVLGTVSFAQDTTDTTKKKSGRRRRATTTTAQKQNHN